MNSISRLMSWKFCIYFSIAVLAALIVFSFYGLYTNKFYFLKPDNYIFPLLTVAHFTFLYVLWFKITENEMTDPQMRNLEYALYIIFLLYVFKFLESIYILMSYNLYENHIIPKTFLPIGVLILFLHLMLLGLTLLAFYYRKILIGNYRFDDINRQIDSWE
ncbi:hypothetical protein [Ulvibacterium sp.]|uniref:hypothetical protein n=1 Tax=Ulvibacterium sp. TaxID=2665914 RepID=UPI0026156791|nr:hypothetical protein [Ulvibacterium sp.]